MSGKRLIKATPLNSTCLKSNFFNIESAFILRRELRHFNLKMKELFFLLLTSQAEQLNLFSKDSEKDSVTIERLYSLFKLNSRGENFYMLNVIGVKLVGLGYLEIISKYEYKITRAGLALLEQFNEALTGPIYRALPAVPPSQIRKKKPKSLL